MASIKVKFRASSVKEKNGIIYYQIIQNRTIRQLKTDYRIYTEEWDQAKKTILLNPERTERTRYLLSVREQIWKDIRRFRHIIASLAIYPDSRYTADEIIKRFQDTAHEEPFPHFMKNVIIQLKRLNREGTAENYTAALNSFLQFKNEKELSPEDITSDLMQEYEAHLKARGLTMNTVSFYMRVLRAVYNRAVEQGITEQRHPFRHVYTGVDKTVKRAISLKHLRKIKELKLPDHSAMAFARDMFMFSFYTRGMSFIDMAYLKKSDLKNGILTYRRRKTGLLLTVKWEKCMQEIVDKYNKPLTQDSPYLLPVITAGDREKKRKQYKNTLYAVNTHLKKIAEQIGLSAPLSTYVARHSWASIAKSKNIPVSVISEGMGHDSEMTTQIYLASLECSVIDKANTLILKEL